VQEKPDLKGLHVVFFERRLADTLAGLIKIQGGTPVAAPAMKEVPLENNLEVFRFGEKLLKGEIDIVLLLTGVVTKFLLSLLEGRYSKENILEALKKISVVPRGPKPLRVMKEWGLAPTLIVPEPNTWKEILETFDKNASGLPLAGKNIAVQEYGVTNKELLSGLRKRKAAVFCVPIYRWVLPDDTQPLKNAIQMMVEGKAELAVFTTAVQIEHLFQVADKMNSRSALQKAFKKMAVASVGPDCSQALKSYGLQVDIEPESPKMGPLVLKIAETAKQILEKKCK